MTDNYNWNLLILLGDEAKIMCNWIMKVRETRGGAAYKDDSIGMWYEKNCWVAYDNSTGDCWIEEFTDIREVYLWVTGQKEIGQ